jgi:hypothetical protein
MIATSPTFSVLSEIVNLMPVFTEFFDNVVLELVPPATCNVNLHLSILPVLTYIIPLF